MIDYRPMGYATIDEVPFPSELPPPNSRCCHGCMRHLGFRWICVCHDDLTWGIYSICDRCVEIGMGFVEWSDLTDEVERRYADRVVQWVDNFYRLTGEIMRNEDRRGIFR